MPQSCIAPGCTNRALKGNGVRFFRVPKDEMRKTSWVNALRRKNWVPKEDDRLCSAHFITGEPHFDIDHPDYVPSVFCFSPNADFKKVQRYERSKKRKVEVLSETIPAIDENDEPNENDEPYENDEPNENDEPYENNEPNENDEPRICNGECFEKIKNLEAEIEELKKEKENLHADLNARMVEKGFMENKLQNLSVSLDDMKDKPDKIRFYTGLINVQIFMWLLNFLKSRTDLPEDNVLTTENQFFMVLSRLRLGLLTHDLAYRYDVSQSYISRTCKKWLKITGKHLKNLVDWPARENARLPKAIKKLYPRCIAIIDCTELKIQRPNGLKARQLTWSNYKNSNTCKFLIAIAPCGRICFISDCWGGRASDQIVTLNCEFLDYLRPRDVILADRGFNSAVQEAFALRGADLIVPAYTKGKNQLSKKEVDKSRQISTVRIHVERAIGRMKYFKILHSIPITLTPIIDDIITTVAAICNLLPPLIN